MRLTDTKEKKTNKDWMLSCASWDPYLESLTSESRTGIGGSVSGVRIVQPKTNTGGTLDAFDG